MHLAQRAYVLIVLTAAVAIAGIWSHDRTFSTWWHLPAALLLIGVAFESFRVRRSVIAFDIKSPSRGYLGRPLPVILALRSDMPRPAVIEFVPALPGGFEPLEQSRKLVAPPRSDGREEITLLPVKLGRQSWPVTRARVLGPLGIAWWPLHLHPCGNITITPDTLRITHISPRGNPAGTRPRRTVGAGSELHQLRDYVHGDPLARIDWKATARTRNLVSREFSEDQHLDVLVMLDAGRFSRVRAGRLDRFGLYANIAARFAEVVTPNDDRIGLLVFSDRPLAVCMPDRGLPAIVRVRRALEKASLSAAESDVTGAAVRARRMLKHRGLIVLLTGFDDPTVADQLTRAVRLLSPPHVVIVAGVQNTEVRALASQAGRDWLDPWVSLAAQEQEARAVAQRVLLRRLGAPVVYAREELLEHAVIAQYEALRRTRRI
jgi:uncharacterized protein (DUF58 family)